MPETRPWRWPRSSPFVFVGVEEVARAETGSGNGRSLGMPRDLVRRLARSLIATLRARAALYPVVTRWSVKEWNTGAARRYE